MGRSRGIVESLDSLERWRFRDSGPGFDYTGSCHGMVACLVRIRQHSQRRRASCDAGGLQSCLAVLAVLAGGGVRVGRHWLVDHSLAAPLAAAWPSEENACLQTGASFRSVPFHRLSCPPNPDQRQTTGITNFVGTIAEPSDPLLLFYSILLLHSRQEGRMGSVGDGGKQSPILPCQGHRTSTISCCSSFRNPAIPAANLS